MVMFVVLSLLLSMWKIRLRCYLLAVIVDLMNRCFNVNAMSIQISHSVDLMQNGNGQALEKQLIYAMSAELKMIVSVPKCHQRFYARGWI